MILMIAGYASEQGQGRIDYIPEYYVLGENQSDCKKKFVYKILKHEGKDWNIAFKKWVSNWRYVRFVDSEKVIT